MSDEQNEQNPNLPEQDTTQSNESSPIQKRPPRELPRRGYDQPRPMNPPPPPPIANQSPDQTPPAYTSRTQPAPAQQRNYQQPPRQQRASIQIPDRSQPPQVETHSPQPRRNTKSDSGLYLPWWSLLLLVLSAGGCAVALIFFVFNSGSGLIPGDQTPQVIVVTNALQDAGNIGFSGNNTQSNTNPNFDPGSVPATQVIAPSAVPFAEPTATLPGVTTGCPLNATVEVVGTEGLPLTIRNEPRQGDNIQSLASEGERLRITGGPQTSTDVNGDALEWCELEGITNPTRDGWAARQFLAIVEE